MFQRTEPAAALRRTVVEHFIRTGSLKAARVFANVCQFCSMKALGTFLRAGVQESGIEISSLETSKFEELQIVIEALRNHDIEPAIV